MTYLRKLMLAEPGRLLSREPDYAEFSRRRSGKLLNQPGAFEAG